MAGGLSQLNLAGADDAGGGAGAVVGAAGTVAAAGGGGSTSGVELHATEPNAMRATVGTISHRNLSLCMVVVSVPPDL